MLRQNNKYRLIGILAIATHGACIGIDSFIRKTDCHQRQAPGLNIKLQVYQFEEVFTVEQIQQVYRILQEAIHNIIQNAHATRADIQIFGHPTEVDILIEDDGKGFDRSIAGGLGLNQMKIRTESLGGRIEINSHPGAGTHILLQVPLTTKIP